MRGFRFSLDAMWARVSTLNLMTLAPVLQMPVFFWSLHMNCRRLAIAAIVSAVLSPAYAQEQAVTPKEIQDTWVSRPLVGKTARGAAATVRLQPDGTASVSAGSANDTGTWRLSGEGYCTTWKNIRSGQERCFTVRRVGATMKVFNPDGSLNGEFNEIK